MNCGLFHSLAAVHDRDAGEDEKGTEDEARVEGFVQDCDSECDAEEWGEEGENREAGDKVFPHEPEPAEIAGEGDDDGLEGKIGPERRGGGDVMKMATPCGKRKEQEGGARELVDQGFGGWRFGESAGADAEGGGGPKDAAENAEAIPEQVVRTAGDKEAAGVADRDAEEGETHAPPLAAAEVFARDEGVQTESGEDRRRIEKDGHVAGRSVVEAEGDGDELAAKKKSDKGAGAEGAIALKEVFAARGHQHDDEEGGKETAQADLKDGIHLRCSGFDRDLLQAPAEAEDDHGSGGEAIEWPAQRGCGLGHGEKVRSGHQVPRVSLVAVGGRIADGGG